MASSGFRGVVHVVHGYLDVCDAVADTPGLASDADADESVGLVRVELGHARLLVGVASGRVRLTVHSLQRDPGPDPGYEDIVEVDFEARTDELAVIDGASGEHLALPGLPFGPGRHRLRYHARGMDLAAGDGDGDGESAPVGEYFLQIWPAAPGIGERIKLTSRRGRGLRLVPAADATRAGAPASASRRG